MSKRGREPCKVHAECIAYGGKTDILTAYYMGISGIVKCLNGGKRSKAVYLFNWVNRLRVALVMRQIIEGFRLTLNDVVNKMCYRDEQKTKGSLFVVGGSFCHVFAYRTPSIVLIRRSSNTC